MKGVRRKKLKADWSEVVSNPKDASKQQARKKVQERKSDGKDGPEAQNQIAKPRPGGMFGISVGL
ncbi:hypothetical protein PAXRUDRAFT_20668 [Paxillus rubicundulus Ve08.2h10]|uniref:Uncharacterized protein n=1 Tax=Paxillus rubicundulus Ve08.2h10 TaxID=930991 RepID=A0A0D0D189_9AGAM|nr:hypothetical protein PAXRUDRAFT_20668 [Paxillus rubicundulus Ve08.2h10]